MNTLRSEPVAIQPRQHPAFAHRAAKGSWLCVLALILVAILGGAAQRHFGEARLVFELIAFMLMVLGFAFGVTDLFGIPRYGTKGILAESLVGIILNGVLLFIFVNNFMAARARALEQRNRAEQSSQTLTAPVQNR
jgi:uncharacterized membrane protein HdeD (DUF308 family)